MGEFFKRAHPIFNPVQTMSLIFLLLFKIPTKLHFHENIFLTIFYLFDSKSFQFFEMTTTSILNILKENMYMYIYNV